MYCRREKVVKIGKMYYVTATTTRPAIHPRIHNNTLSLYNPSMNQSTRPLTYIQKYECVPVSPERAGIPFSIIRLIHDNLLVLVPPTFTRSMRLCLLVILHTIPSSTNGYAMLHARLLIQHRFSSVYVLFLVEMKTKAVSNPTTLLIRSISSRVNGVRTLYKRWNSFEIINHGYKTRPHHQRSSIL